MNEKHTNLKNANPEPLWRNGSESNILPKWRNRSYRPCMLAKSKKSYTINDKTVVAVRISHCVEGAEYLLRRGIEKESWDLFDIRYIVSDFLHDHVMIPVYENNELRGIVARDITGRSKKRYYNIGSLSLFNFEKAFERSFNMNLPVIVVEGIFDAIILWQIGASAVAVNGNASIMKPEILSKLDKFNNVILFPDIEDNLDSLKHFTKAKDILAPKAILVDTLALYKEKKIQQKKIDVTDIYLKCDKDKERFKKIIENIIQKYRTEGYYSQWHYRKKKHSQYDIEAVAYAYLNIAGTFGRGLRAYCPWHPDSDPSLRIYLDTNSFYCFGCGASGDTITLIAKMENVSRKRAYEIYKNNFQGERHE